MQSEIYLLKCSNYIHIIVPFINNKIEIINIYFHLQQSH